jgi:hypothetical protein
MRRITFSALFAVLAFAVVDVTALAYTTRTLEMFARTATLTSGGLKVQVGGPLQCSGGVDSVRATVTEPGSGDSGALAYGEGRWRGTCTGTPQTWHATVGAAGTNHFRPGRALACGLAVAHDPKGKVAHVRQWCNRINLVR